MKYGIAIFPSKPIQDKANSFRKRYDPHYALIPPHITLKEAFRADEELIAELITELRNIAQEMDPFTISIKKFSTFAPVTNTIYMKVEPVPELQKLYDQMHQGIFPQNAKYSFVPHITIAQKIDEAEYADILGSVQMQGVQFEDEVDRFQLLYQLENGSWTVYETFIFGQDFS